MEWKKLNDVWNIIIIFFLSIIDDLMERLYNNMLNNDKKK